MERVNIMPVITVVGDPYLSVPNLYGRRLHKH